MTAMEIDKISLSDGFFDDCGSCDFVRCVFASVNVVICHKCKETWVMSPELYMILEARKDFYGGRISNNKSDLSKRPPALLPK